MTEETEQTKHGLSPELEEWYGHPVTEQFFRFVERVRDDALETLTSHLKGGNPIDAGFCTRAAEVSALGKAISVYLTPTAFDQYDRAGKS